MVSTSTETIITVESMVPVLVGRPIEQFKMHTTFLVTYVTVQTLPWKTRGILPTRTLWTTFLVVLATYFTTIVAYMGQFTPSAPLSLTTPNRVNFMALNTN